MTEHCRLDEAIERHVRPGDAIHVIMGHSRWTALVRELARQYWQQPAGFTLIHASLSSSGVLLFRAGCVARVVTAYSGDSFPTYTPNPVYQDAYRSGAVDVEHWSFLALMQRLQAAADGLPAAVTGSIRGSSMAANEAYTEVDGPTGPVSLLAPLVPDVAFVHAAVADEAGNLAMAPPLLEGVAGAFAARRGVIATVDRVVEDLRHWSAFVRIPAHRVLAIVEARFGAHPGGLHTGDPGELTLPVAGYGEDIPFWIQARDAARGADLDDWIRQWCLDLDTHEAYLDQLGRERLDLLERRADPASWRLDDEATPVDEDAPVTDAERAAVWAAAVLADRVAETQPHAVLAGAGLANLAAWLGVARARAAGHDVRLTAELGMWDYAPTPADPFIFNFRSFPTTSILADAQLVLGTLMGGPGTRSIACVGAAQVDRHGNLNSTEIPDGPFLVGSGGANDVVTRADETLVVTALARTVEECGYVTSPGERVHTIVTSDGILERHDGEFRLVAVPSGPGPLEERVRAARDRCGWDLAVPAEVRELPEVTIGDALPLRDHDRHGWFLGR